MVTAMIIWNSLIFIIVVMAAIREAQQVDAADGVIATLIGVGSLLTTMTLAGAIQ